MSMDRRKREVLWRSSQAVRTGPGKTGQQPPHKRTDTGGACVCPSGVSAHMVSARWKRAPHLQTQKKNDCFSAIVPWWGKVDSNHRSRRQQIYSLPHLTALELSHIRFSLRLEKNWSWWTDSNPRPADYKSAALPAELHQHLNARIIYHKSSVESSPKSKKIEKIVYFPLLSSSVMTAAEFFAARAVNFE